MEKKLVKLPDIMTGSITLENVLPIWVLKWLVILVGYKIKVINDLEARKSKNSFVWLCSLKFKRLTLESQDFCSLEIYSRV